jgi:hypothetical protein
MNDEPTQTAALALPVELPVRPRVWARKDQLQHASTRGGLLCAMYPHTKGRADLEPLYDQAALEATADDAARLAREAEAHYWRSMVERLTAQADACSDRYWALVREVADGRAMQPAPAIVVDLGPN